MTKPLTDDEKTNLEFCERVDGAIRRGRLVTLGARRVVNVTCIRSFMGRGNDDRDVVFKPLPAGMVLTAEEKQFMRATVAGDASTYWVRAHLGFLHVWFEGAPGWQYDTDCRAIKIGAVDGEVDPPFGAEVRIEAWGKSKFRRGRKRRK